MKAVAASLIAGLVVGAEAPSAGAGPSTSPALAAPGPGLRRVTNMPDGAPAFEVRNIQGLTVSRIECIFNGGYDSDSLAARLMSAPAVMAAAVAKQGRISIDDLGPAIFDCVVVPVRGQP